MAATTNDTLARFQRLFRGRETAFGQWQKGKIDTISDKGPTVEHWKAHLAGKGPLLGIVPVTLDNQCYFGAIDYDDDTVNHSALAGIISHAQLPLVCCRSKSGAAHLYVFLRDPVSADSLQKKLRGWAVGLGLKQNPNGSVVEVFPKQANLARDRAGNWINLPYYGGDKAKNYAVNDSGEQLDLVGFLDHAERLRVSSTELSTLEAGGVSAFADGPPCLTTLHGLGYEEGTRNQGLLNVGIYWKLRANFDDDVDWEDEVRQYNEERMDPPLKDREVDGIIKSLQSRDYRYRCEEMPIEPHCQKALCKKQKYGIGGFRRKDNEQKIPEMDDLRKVTTDPPRWLLNVAGKEIDLTTEDLMLMPRFRRAVMEKCSMVFPLLKQFEWDEQLTKLLESHKVIEAPEDAGIVGQFRFLLSEFLMRRLKAQSKEDLLAGLPVEVEGLVYFRSSDFLQFLDRKKFRDYTPPKVFTALKSLGCGSKAFNIKGANVNTWFLEAPKQEQKEDFTPLEDNEPRY